MKKLLLAFALLCMISVLVVACGGTTTGTGSGNSSSGNATVHMGQTNFDQSSVTISKGGTVTLVSDTSSVHIISNGQWVNGVARPGKESGAPTVDNVQFTSAGESKVIGPFNTAGTFHLYCSVHPGMQLTIIVQ
jgi:plastocyanin